MTKLLPITDQLMQVCGCSGCGKTALIQELQSLTGNQDAVHLQIDDQMDTKSLLGAYVCTSIPGKFRWQQGPLAEAISQGKWIIIEDLNSAPSQVLAALVPLLESGKLSIPQRGEVLEAQNGFQLIATVTTAPLGLSSGAYASSIHLEDILGGLLTHVSINSPPFGDQLLILKNSFPALSPVMDLALSCLWFIQRATGQINGSDLEADPNTEALVERCLEKSGLEKGPISFHIGRHYSIRDVFKWCKRMTDGHGEALNRLRTKDSKVKVTQLPYAFRNAALAECHDIYVSFISKAELRCQLMTGFAALWCLTNSDVESLMYLQKPVSMVDDAMMTMGRARLPILENWTLGRDQDSLFVHTGQSARLMEQVGLALQLNEAVLLVGETGTGKTALIQHIANQVKVKLIVLNLSQQTDSSELIGGYKPITAREVLLPLVNPFVSLFRRTWTKGNNETFLSRVLKFAEKEDWKKLKKAFEMAVAKIRTDEHAQEQDDLLRKTGPKRQKLIPVSIKQEWTQFESEMAQAFELHTTASSVFAFSFIEGTLIKAVKCGYWLFLDEINLAPPEALQALASVLEHGSNVHITLPDKGSHTIKKHPHFRLIGAMNPATDSGKRDLATSLRNKFTEFWVPEAESMEDLELIVSSYLSPLGPSMPISRIVKFYLILKEEAKGVLYNGGGQSPCYSLRTLCRFLEYVKRMIRVYGLDRTLFDAALMTFVTQLETESVARAHQLIHEHLLEKQLSPKVLEKAPRKPQGMDCVLFEQYWIERGPEEAPDEESFLSKKFILTPSIRRNLRDISRALVLRKYPILLQGPTSSGKTSLVAYLAAHTGHKMIRINNHEHTDLQEYLGSYIANKQGQLEFVDGALVQAVKQGYWLVLDELNLAPNEVLEALNRLLDDNRELYIPDLQQTIKPHPHFALFATQNPPGVYSGRKHLSRAFRSRFLELNVDGIPDEELTEILEHRCKIPGSYARKMVEVMRELQRRRQSSNTFAGKLGFITPRDLFRWAERPAHGYLQLAQNGYYLLAERLRSEEEKLMVQEVLCKVMKTQMGELYDVEVDCEGIVWIPSTQRIFSLLQRCLESSEAALLIGETGTGKTTVCQKLAEINGQKLHILNCNMQTETSDFIGGYRPIRNRSKLTDELKQLCQEFDNHGIWKKHSINPMTPSGVSSKDDLNHKAHALQDLTNLLNPNNRKHKHVLDKLRTLLENLQVCYSNLQMPFVWEDGVLVEAMKNGDMILIDELNLVDDAVLERMNSVLDPCRSITLPEKGGSPAEVVIAHPSFRFVATMNPGGDFGKKELSPALTNRFTQIWVPQIQSDDELGQIIVSQLSCMSDRNELSKTLVGFYSAFQQQMKSSRQVLSLRDFLSVINFTNSMNHALGVWSALLHGIVMVFLDGLEMNIPITGGQLHTMEDLRVSSYQYLLSAIPQRHQSDLELAMGRSDLVHHQLDEQGLIIGPFRLPWGPAKRTTGPQYDFKAPTPKRNLFRLLRAMQLRKAVLLEGSPGVGKTSLVVNLANLTGYKLIRINLSEQTDMMDLLGSDLPVAGGQAGEFAWSDGPLLSAIKSGDWILLDELNLANQQVLEGLNALIDHRVEIYIPELKECFHCPSSFRLFASQNPTSQGGGRKGLPKSFLNRFTRVYMEPLDQADMTEISTALSGHLLNTKSLQKMVQFLNQLSQLCNEGKLGVEGGPWEFNLRDFLRWSEIIEGHTESDLRLNKAAQILFLQRFRSVQDRNRIKEIYEEIFSSELELENPRVLVSETVVVIGDEILKRNQSKGDGHIPREVYLMKQLAPYLESLAITVSKNWPALIVGPSCSGKTSIVCMLATLCNRSLIEISLTSGTDTGDLLGGFEQLEPYRELQTLLEEAASILSTQLCKSIDQLSKKDLHKLLKHYGRILELNENSRNTSETDTRRAALIIKSLSEIFTSQSGQFGGLSHLGSAIDDFLSKLSTFEVESFRSGCFEWVDGALVRAMEQGKWVLLDHANLCNSSVLDRLNSVLEPNGCLHLNECGIVDAQNGTSRIIKPHPDFRIFLSYNPKHGEISRAMRNRAIEVYLPQEISVVAESIADLPSMWNAIYKVYDDSICYGLRRVHQDFLVNTKHEMGWMPTIRDYKNAVLISKTLQEAGNCPTEAFSTACDQVYSNKTSRIDWNSQAGKFQMQTANVPEWVLSALFVSNLASNSSFSAFCRETVVLLRYIHDPENTKCLAFHTVIPRLNANQLILLHQWIQSNHHLQFPEARILDLLMEMESIKQFMKTADGPDPVQELVPLDQSYWKSIKPVFSPSLDPEVLELMLDLVQFEYKQQWICATIDSKLLGQNSVLQLSFIRSQDQQFRLSFASVNPLLIECLYPVFLSLKNILKEALDDINKNSDFLSPLKRLLNFVAQFWNHWNKTDLKSCQHPSFLMESSIYTWIKIKKYTKLLTVALSKNSKASAEWKIASMSLDQALELPENVPQKLLLWKYGSHPKLHRSLTSALHHSKLNQICQIFNINGSPCWEGANEVTGLLQDLHILRGCSDSTPEIRGLVLKLSGDTNLRKVLIEGLSMTSLTAYASRSLLESDQVITEVLESCVQQIQSLVNKQRAPSELLPNLSTYEVFLSSDQLTDPANVDLQLDLASFHWTLFASKPIPATLNFMMEVINTHQPKYEVQQGSLRELKDWESEGISRSLFPLTLFQSVKDLVWMLEMDPNEVLYSRENALTLLTNVLYEWQLNLSMNQIQFLPNDYIIQGASVLYQGTLANSVGSMLAKVPSILEAPGKIIQLKLAARLLISSSSSMSTETHWDHIRVHIVTCLTHILASHASSLPEANQEPFTQLLISVWQSMKWKSHGTELEADQHLIRCLRLQLRLSHHETLVSCIDGLILPCCQSLMKSKRSSGLETVLSLGHAWIYLGVLRVTLVHPPAGFDPSTKQQMKSQNLEFLLETKLRPLLKLRQEINGLPGGFDETEKIKKLSGEIEELESKLEELRETMVPRPEPSQYLELYSHIHQFITMHCSAERIQNLLTCFQSNDCLNAVSKSQNWIVVCRHFIQQTSVRFPLYIDIWQPICHGLLELSHGFSALTSFEYLKSKSEPFYSTVTCSAMELMKIDSTCSKSSPMELSKVLMEASASLLGNIGEQEAFHVQLKYLMARLNHSKEMVVELEGFPDCPKKKQNFCSLALSLMSVFEKLQVIEEAHLSEKSQLFKTQISHGETDEELVEASYHSMFPDEAKYFADLTQHHMDTSLVHEMNLKDNQQSHTGSLLDGSVAKTVAKIHQEVFNGINRIPKNTGDFEMRFSTGLELLDVIGKVVPRQFDDQISLGCLMRLCKEHRKLTRRPVQHSSQSCFIDFYSSCPEEVQLTHQCLRPLNSRLNQLLEDWPEHPLLTQIQEFSTRVLALSIKCPLKRVMTGLELMLSRAQLWEDTVASKKLSLNSELKLVSKLITRWQRMELENWKTVLDRIKTRHAEDARKTWFYILRILLPSDSLSTADLTSTLEQYLITSTQGEFSERLMILFSFHNQIQDQQQYPLNHILANLVGFYSQYKTPVQSALESGLKPIEKELLEFVKLQNWEDRGYYNLMKTGERSQRKLHKFCMRAEEILKQPMAAILSQHVQSMGYTDLNQKLEETQDSSISVISLQKPLELALDVHHEVTEDWTGLLSSVGTGSRFQELPRLVKKMSEILKSSWAPKTQHSGCSLGDLSNSVIARVRALQQDTEKNSKGRKKKALSDFLNLLPSLGISKRKSDVPENEQTILSWFQQPTMDQLPSWTDQLGLSKQKTQQVLDSANGYYFKCMDRMQRVWETGVQPNKALSLNEVNLMMKFSEHFLFVLRQQRQVLKNTNQSLTRLISVLNLVNGLCTVGGKPPLPDQHSVAESLCSQWNILKELKQAVMAERELLEHIDEVEDHELVSQAIKRCSDQCETSMECINSCISSLQIVQSRTAPCIYIHKDQQIIQNNFESLLGLCVKLKDHQNGNVESQRLKELGFGCNSDMACIAGWSELMNVFDSAMNKVQDALNCLNTKQMSVSETGVPNYDEFSQNIESCIVELMLWFQKQHQEGPPSTSVSILETNQQFQDHLSYNKINRISSCLFDCIQKISEMSETAYKTEDPDLCENLVQGATLMAKTTQCLEPAGHLLIQRVIHLWTELLDHHRGTSKLCYITMSVFLGLLKEGFCNEESEDGEEEGEGNFDSGDGTGLSSGQGLKDISDEIENEDQILGTEDNTDEIEKSNNNNESEEQNKGIEMEQDFNGTYENIEQELEQEEEDSGEEDDNQIENEMGKVGEDGEAVDEKLWNDEDNSDEKDQTTHDGNNYPQTGDQEYIEGQLEDSEETKQDSKESKRDPEIIPRQQDQEESAEEGDEETEGGSEEAEGPPMEGFTKPEPPEEELDLPEDLNLDTEGPNDDQDSLASTENADPAELEEPVVQKFAEEEDGDLDGMEVDQETTTAPQDEPEVVPEDDVNEEGGTKEETMTPEDSTIPEGTEAAAIGHQEGALELEEQDLGLAMRHENQNSIEESSCAATAPVPSRTGPVEYRTDLEQNTRHSDHQEVVQKHSVNPLRSLGDALEQWKEDLRVVDPETKDNRNPETQTGEAEEYEFLMEQAPDSLQTIAHATEDQMKQMGDLEEPLNEQKEDSCQIQEQDDFSLKDPKTVEQGPAVLKEKSRTGAGPVKLDEQDLMEEESDVEMEELEENEDPVEEKFAHWKLHELDAMTEDQEQEKVDPTTTTATVPAVQDPFPVEISSGQRLWNQCQASTSSLASELTEHLQLILEPTLASRLAGDYRTGKRINMKRVIPYIASQYRKDKIWLRRTKPDKRKYQVLLAVDDSQSMSNIGCGAFALESLTLISRAMSRLEVGEIGLLSFGGSGEINILHSLGVPFTDSHGPQIMQQLKFNQDNRIEDRPMLQLIKSLDGILQSAEKQYCTNHELHQLVTIIADGRFHERSTLKQEAHKLCTKPGVLVVFVILDNPNNSLVDMTTVEFEDGKPQFKKYLDHFPFPYYIVLNDISALPRTLADLLRQWFQISST